MAVDQLSATFAALADPTRRAILVRLAEGEATVGQLAAQFPMSPQAVSKHLLVLERAGLVATGRDAQRRPRRLRAAPLGAATGWLEQYRRLWEDSFDRLSEHLRATLEPPPPPAPPGAAGAVRGSRAHTETDADREKERHD